MFDRMHAHIWGLRALCLASILVFFMVACEPLHLKAGDSPGLKAAKVIARIPVGIVTLGNSEA